MLYDYSTTDVEAEMEASKERQPAVAAPAVAKRMTKTTPRE